MNKTERIWQRNREIAAKLKNPTPQELPSHAWRCQIMCNGKRVSFIADAPEDAYAQALAARAGLVETADDSKPNMTLTAAIDAYISSKNAILSPATIRGYRCIQRNRFQSTMSRNIWEIKDEEWQGLINLEAADVSGKTVKNAFAFIKSVIAQQTGHEIPTVKITMPKIKPATRAFLTSDEIPIFVESVKDEDIAVPALLALSSLRVSEIYGLRWEDIPVNPKLLQVSGAVVNGPDGKLVHKAENKNESSTRLVPMLIPELSAALERERKPEGFVVTCAQTYLRDRVHAVCKAAKITDVTIHGLRHSFASLSYHLQVPERIAMEIGGWADQKTMHSIYTHIEKSDVEHYQGELSKFYSKDDQAATETAS